MTRLLSPRAAALAGLCSVLLAASPAVARDWNASGFDKVDLAASATVRIHAAPGFAIHAEGDPDLIRRLDIAVRRGTLVIGWLPGQAPHTMRNQRLAISVTMPRVAGATVSGAGTIAVDRAEAPAFAGRVGGAGTLRIATLRTRAAALDVSGAGTLEAAGTADRVVAHLTGVGSIKAGALGARAGLIDMTGTGSIVARVDGPVEVRLSGLGSVAVLGKPACVVRKTGWGSVRCGARAKPEKRTFP
jgi:hypothetical protein